MAQCKKCIQNTERYILALKMKSPFKTGTALAGIPEGAMHHGCSGLPILTDICTPTLQRDAQSASHPRAARKATGKLKSKAGRKERLTDAVMIPKLPLLPARADAVTTVLVLMTLGFPQTATGACSPQGGRGRILRVGHSAGNA